MRALCLLSLLCIIALAAPPRAPALARPAAPALRDGGAGQIRADEQPPTDDRQPPAPDQAPSLRPAALIRDIAPGNLGAAFGILGQSGGLVYLSRWIGPSTAQLWRSDGQPGGTRLVQAGFSVEPQYDSGGAYGFTRLVELLGAPAGTVMAARRSICRRRRGKS